MVTKRKYTEAQFIEAVETSRSVREVLLKLDLTGTGGSYTTFYRYVKKLGISTDHLKGQAWNLGIVIGPQKPIEEYLIKDSTIKSHSLRLRLLKAGIFEYKCNKCKLTEWNSLPIPLQLEHKDGDHYNNLLENLELLCPNCHAQTSTYCGKNKKYKHHNQGAIKTRRIRTEMPAKKHKEPKKLVCGICGVSVSMLGNHCRSCAGKLCSVPKINWLPIEELLERLKMSNYSALARELGVSDNAIRKHIKTHTSSSLTAWVP